MEVYGKYIDPDTTHHTNSTFTNLILQIAAGTAPGGTVVDGGGYAGNTSSFDFGAASATNNGGSSGSGPKAYLNWLVFDRSYNLIASKSGYMRMGTAAREYGQDATHERLYGSVSVNEPGYVYIYVSNEEGSNPYEVYFDDMKVEQSKSPVVQMDDYYPFGLSFNSYQRENSLSNQFLFNGIEREDELDLKLDFAVFRSYNPSIGRWLQIDPKAADHESPYAGMGNNPLTFSDNLGDTVKYEGKDQEIEKLKKNDQELKKTRMGRKILRQLEKSENVHNTRAVPKGGEEDKEGRQMRVEEYGKADKGEISETEKDEYLTAGGTVLSDSDIKYFRENDYDGKDSDGTGTGSVMFFGADEAAKEYGGLATFAHERIHQYKNDKGIVSKKYKGNKSVNEIRTQRQTYRLIRQYNRATGNNVKTSKNYYQ